MNLRRYRTAEKPSPGSLALDEKQERAFLKMSSAVLASCFSNPSRSGCPDSSVLQRIAANNLRLKDAAPWMSHLGSCSECYHDFEKYKEAHRQKVVRLVYSMAASVVLAALLAIVLWRSHGSEIARHPKPPTEITSGGTNGNSVATYVPFVLDLRNAAQVRGKNGSSRSVVKLPKMPLHVLAYLPMGSDSGEYTVSLNKEGKPVWSGLTDAQLRNKRMLTEFDSDLTPYPPGRYALEFSSKSGLRLRQNVDLEEQTQRK